MGLLLSRQLLQAGASVTLLEAGQCGNEASWAGGGIVSPLYPWRYPDAVTALASSAQSAFPALCDALHAETGIDPQYRQTGLLLLDAPDASAAFAWATQHGRAMQAVPAARLHTLAPQLSDGFTAGLWMPTVANVRNPRLLQALLASLQRCAKFSLREFAPVTQLCDGEVQIVGGDRLRAGVVIVCAGAWSGALLAAAGVNVPVVPVLGQMLLYRWPESMPLRTMVLHDGRYAIPRADGLLLVGSTLEQRGFDKNISEEAAQTLQQAAANLLPALRDVTPLRQWAGLRPGSPDGVPLMGAVPGFARLWLCAGHFRNGLVLSPASAQLMADLLLQRTPAIDPAPYAIGAG